jgi:hypothetical protein
METRITFENLVRRNGRRRRSSCGTECASADSGAAGNGAPIRARRRVRRFEVFAGSAAPHCWPRELVVLGRSVELVAPKFLKPHLKTSKNDAYNRGAPICEVVSRPNLRPMKPIEQRAILDLQRTLGCVHAYRIGESDPWAADAVFRAG